jgi:CHAT domain-containing protein/TPR repeat protein
MGCSQGIEMPSRAAIYLSRITLTLVCLVAAANCARAQEAQWQTAIQKTGCFTDRLSTAALVLIASAWDERPLPKLFADAAQTAALSKLTGPDSSKVTPQQLTQTLGQVLKAAGAALERLNADSRAYGAALCPVLYVQAGADFRQTLNVQTTPPPQPYLSLAEFALTAQGCTASSEDPGSFAERSAAAWQKAAANLRWQPKDAKRPSVGETVRLLAEPLRSDLCEPSFTGQSIGGAGALLALARLYAPDPKAGCGGDARPADLAAIAEIVRAEPEAFGDFPEYGPTERCPVRERLLYDMYRRAKRGELDASAVAKAHLAALGYLKSDKPEQVEDGVSTDWVQATLTKSEYNVSIRQIPTLTRLGELVARDDKALAMALDAANPFGQTQLGITLTEGLSDAGKKPDRGVRLFEAAAAADSSFALLRVAQAYEQGYGVPADPVRAVASYTRLANLEQPAGLLALARIYEDGQLVARDLVESGKWYRALLATLRSKPPSGGDGDHSQQQIDWTDAIADALQDRLLAGAEFLSSPEGRQTVLEAARKHPKLVAALGDASSCVDCGAAIDLRAAAEWYRIGIGVGSANENVTEIKLRLARLLLANPALSNAPDEAITLLQAAAESSSLAANLLPYVTAKPGAADDDLVARVAAQLGPDTCKVSDEEFNEGCIQFAHLLATGGLDIRLVKVGFDHLKTVSDQILARTPLPESIAGVVAFADVLAFYGDFEGARAVLNRATGGLTSGEAYKARNAVIRRLINTRPSAANPRISALRGLLDTLTAKGDSDARMFRQILSGQAASAPDKLDEPISYDSAVSEYHTQLARGGISRGVAAAARRLSEAEQQRSNPAGAIRLELEALNTEIELENAAGIFTGPLPAALARVCLYSKASRRIFDLGSTDVALVLAKTAVNELQDVRRGVRELPERLQLCFTDVVSDHYRWLADLFIRQGRPAIAERVLGFLKDFETFQFLDRDRRFQGAALDQLPLSNEELKAQKAIAEIRIPVAVLGPRQRELQMLRSRSNLTAAQQQELEAVETELRAYAAKSSELVEQLKTAAKTAGGPDTEARLTSLGSIQSRLRVELQAHAVALHYVVLPTRMHIILTLPVGIQLTHTWDRLDDQPFDENALNKKIDLFRTLLQKPVRNPVPLAQEFYDLLIGPFAKEIAASGAHTLLVSLDRKLRYVPVAALHDGKSYLVQSFQSVAMTETISAGREVSANASMSAFGTTREYPGFPMLPAAKFEVDGLIKNERGEGIFKGREFLDVRFNRQSLSDGMLFGRAGQAELGMVHIASHFNLGKTNAASFLLLGDGGRLSIKDIQDNMGARREFDFGDVDLLTLSACETAYAAAGADGREFESFATAVQREGVRAVVGSLWRIADRASALFMHLFYKNATARKLPRDAALAETQRAFIKGDPAIFGEGARPSVGGTARDRAQPRAPDYTHPYFWAPFILMQGIRNG